jgi:hypothetical protein
LFMNLVTLAAFASASGAEVFAQPKEKVFQPNSKPFTVEIKKEFFKNPMSKMHLKL